MTIDNRAIEEFLLKANPEPIDIKGTSSVYLQRLIQDCTGQTYQPKTVPRFYTTPSGVVSPQLEALSMAIMLERFLVFYGMRLGKTKIALDWISQYKKADMLRGKTLIIAHAPIGIDVWVDETAKHSDLLIEGIRSGVGLFDRFMDAIEGPCDMIAIPWSTLQLLFTEKRERRTGLKKGQPKLYPDYITLRMTAPFFDAVIIDETHRCKNHMSLWFTLAAELVKHCRFRMGLTGTPIGRNPLAIWSQAFLIDGGVALSKSYYFFEQAFGTKRKMTWLPNKPTEWVFDKKKMHLLNEKLASFSMSYQLKDVQIVDVQRGIVKLHMSGKQLAAYEKVLEKAIEERIEGEKEMRSMFTQLRQIASGFVSFSTDEAEKKIHVFPDAVKAAWLSEFLDELDPMVQILIFHEFIQSGRIITDMLTKKKIKHGWIWGGSTKDGEQIKAFQTGKTRVLVLNSVSGSMAIDLPMADYILFYESTCDPITRAQAEARPSGRGSLALLIEDLLCAPIEEKILGFISEGKVALSSMLNPKQELNLLKKRRV